ncbi:MAG: EAL domain-containing protein [Pyrinomonadaceae bacterium]|nr:EAL domain-containing protein [Pyrinomonadaceae bacterium]
MHKRLRVLNVEDEKDDALLLERHLSRAGYELMFEQVATLETMGAALDEQSWDIVISDYHLSHFNGLDALALLKERELDLPFIILSGTIGEDIAVAAMRAGANDYLMKGNLARLVPAIERELQEGIHRRERRTAEEALRQSEERFRLLVDGVRDYAIFMLDPEGRVASWNAGAERVLGYTEAEITGQHFSCLFTPEDIVGDLPAQELRIVEAEGRDEHERLLIRRDGTRFWASSVITAIRDETGRLRGFSKVMRDITESRSAEERITHEAFHDSLTGLPNRLMFTEHLKRAIAHAKRHDDYLYAVLFLDLDRFKVVNDSLGHAIGDQLLVATARKLEKTLRPEDVVARIGGDEFTILLNDIHGISDATHIADRIHHELQRSFHFDGHDVFTTTSIGIALSTAAYNEPDEVLRDADTAMYRAKSLGKMRYEIFDPSMHARAMKLMKFETELRQAVEREEFCLHYQPFVLLKTGKIRGFEALVRWQHPERGLVFPDEFIPIAEDTGLIMPIGRWVLYEACRQMREWQDQFHHDLSLAINVNLSGKQFSQSDLIQQIDDVLQQTGLDPNCLKLEITESAIMEKAESSIVMLKQLRDLGVKLYIDDFGTGFSSLSYLHRFPVDMLKIDRSFVSLMNKGNENSEIVRTIVKLAHNLEMEVMAEGVETAEQLEELRALGCEYAQGYFFSEPVDSEKAKTLIEV